MIKNTHLTGKTQHVCDFQLPTIAYSPNWYVLLHALLDQQLLVGPQYSLGWGSQPSERWTVLQRLTWLWALHRAGMGWVALPTCTTYKAVATSQVCTTAPVPEPTRLPWWLPCLSACLPAFAPFRVTDFCCQGQDCHFHSPYPLLL